MIVQADFASPECQAEIVNSLEATGQIKSWDRPNLMKKVASASASIILEADTKLAVNPYM